MNMSLDIVNGARYSAGLLRESGEERMKLLSREDKFYPELKELYEVCKSVFLKTFLEALSEVPWTMGRKRKRLLRTRLPHGDSGFAFTYNLPYDCARPVELSGKDYYVIDGDFLCTDAQNAELLYVSNGKRLPLDTVFERTSVTDYARNNYDVVLSPGRIDEWDIPVDFTVSLRIDDLSKERPSGSDEDYPEYQPPRYEQKFYEYLEMMMAAKFAVKNTEQPRLHDTLTQKALLIKQEAVKSTKGIATGKEVPSPWWSDRINLDLDF